MAVAVVLLLAKVVPSAILGSKKPLDTSGDFLLDCDVNMR